MRTLVDYLEVEHIYAQTCEKGFKSVAVCAANAHEGVSTVACALAERHQAAGKKTLLIDMNYFRPSLDERFCLPRLNWSGTPVQPPKAVFNDLSGIHVLTAALSADASLKQSDSLQNMMTQWENEYDAVIVDTSPLNAVNRHNVAAEFICARVQAVLMVIRSGITPEGDILAGLSKLQSQNVELLGIVMNDVDCPPLAEELQREIERLSPIAPRFARWLSCKVTNSVLLNMVL